MFDWVFWIVSQFQWMAWTLETALFFGFIASALICMTVWELLRPGGAPRQGILGLTTTRGDRLFISLVGAAYINLAWLGFVGSPLHVSVGLSLAFALAVFRWV